MRSREVGSALGLTDDSGKKGYTIESTVSLHGQGPGNAQKKRREPFKEARKHCRHSCEDDEVAAIVYDTSRGQLVSLSIGQLVRYHCEDDEVAAVACDTSSGIGKTSVAGDRCHTVFPSIAGRSNIQRIL